MPGAYLPDRTSCDWHTTDGSGLGLLAASGLGGPGMDRLQSTGRTGQLAPQCVTSPTQIEQEHTVKDACEQGDPTEEQPPHHDV